MSPNGVDAPVQRHRREHAPASPPTPTMMNTGSNAGLFWRDPEDFGIMPGVAEIGAVIHGLGGFQVLTKYPKSLNAEDYARPIEHHHREHAPASETLRERDADRRKEG